MNERMKLRWSRAFDAWRFDCPRCYAMVVRQNWATAVSEARRHAVSHGSLDRLLATLAKSL